MTNRVIALLMRFAAEGAHDPDPAESFGDAPVDGGAVLSNRSVNRTDPVQPDETDDGHRREQDSRRGRQLPAQPEENSHGQDDPNERDSGRNQRLLDESADA